MSTAHRNLWRDIEGLADALLAGPWQEQALIRRGAKAFGSRPRWLKWVVRDVLAATGADAPPTRDEMLIAIMGHRAFQQWLSRRTSGQRLLTWIGRKLADLRGRPRRWNVPAITSHGALAQWFDLDPARLEGLADPGFWERHTEAPRLLNYHYRWVRKRSGTPRLIEVPKPRLKALQHQVHAEILASIPVHDAAHGFCRGRSVRSFVAPHLGQDCVVRLDLADFFASISAFRVRAIFRAAGYRDPVARMLAGVCTNAAPPEVYDTLPEGTSTTIAKGARQLYTTPHLPQGACTSPALANFAAWRLDHRLNGLARKAGARYTRYADDLLFSGDRPFARGSRRFVVQVAAIAMEEGFSIAFRKTRVMSQGVRQHAAGVVLNVHPNVARDEFDRLKAVLHNCVMHGPAEQNRLGHENFRAHLTGRVSHVASLNPGRGAKLQSLLTQIAWNHT